MTVADGARDLVRRGFAPVPVPFRAKGPRLPDWGSLRIGEDDVPRYFNGAPQNVGIILGAPSNHVIDVDLDSPEAVAAGPYLLPETGCRWGRPSKPNSHWDYRTPDAPGLRRTAYADPMRKTLDDKPIMLVELRGNGCQSLVPPSAHPSGEAFEWAANGEPAVVAGAVLQRAVALVATTALVAPRWPSGARHDAALALAGFLARGGMPEHEIEWLLEVVARVAGDPEWRDRVRAARDTMRTLERGGKVKGAPSLLELLPDGQRVIGCLTTWLHLTSRVERAGRDCPSADTGVGRGADARWDREAPPRRRPALVTVGTVPPEQVSWLWRPYLPRRKLAVLEGDPAAGKTYLALAIAAAVSRGAALPDPVDGIPRDGRPPADVVYLSCEDGIADTLRPRLDRLGADVARIHVLQGILSPTDGVAGSVTLSDLDVIDAALEQTAAVLLIVDPLQGFLGAGVDLHRANEVRPVLAGLARLAERRECAVLIVRHLSKAKADRAAYRGMGSIDITAAARSVLLAGRDPQDPLRRALVQTKMSVAPEGCSLGYTIGADGFGWTGKVDVTAQHLLAADPGPPPPRDEATEFLRAALADGPRKAHELYERAAQARISQSTLKRAKASLGVQSRKGSFQDVWWWVLPDHHAEEGQNAEGGQPCHRENLALFEGGQPDGLGPLRADGGRAAGEPGKLSGLWAPAGREEALDDDTL